MDMRSTLSHLQSDNCLEAELFRSWLKKEATLEEWATGVAVAESGRAGSVSPRVYPVMSDVLRTYCVNRSEGRMDYDPALAARLGAWFSHTMAVTMFNLERLEHYTWAASLTKKINAVEAFTILLEACERFARVSPNTDDIRLCLHTKRIDAASRIGKAGA